MLCQYLVLVRSTWQDRVTNASVLSQARMPSMFAMLSQRRLRWLGHACRMEDGRIPKDMLYGELATGSRPTGRPTLRYKDTCKRDLKASGIQPADVEAVTCDRIAWRAKVHDGGKSAEERREREWEERRTSRQQRSQPTTAAKSPTTDYICSKCHRYCKSRIGLYSHSRRCSAAD